MNSRPLVHVLVINWNGMDHLRACYDSLLESTYTNARFILLDNNSEDSSVSFVQEIYGDDSRVSIIEFDTNLGWSGANNRGMEAALEANADFVLLLNNDTRVEPDFLDHLVDLAESDSSIGALSPRILMYDEPQIINSIGLEVSVIGAGWDTAIGRVDDSRWDTQDPILGVCGAAMFLRCETLRKTGLLPEEFGIYLDDLDLSLRIWQAGVEIRRCYDSVVFHKFSATMGESKSAKNKYYLNTRNRSRIMLRHFIALRPFYVSTRFIVGEIRAVGRGLLNGELWKIPVHVRTWIDLLRYIGPGQEFRSSQQSMSSADAIIWSMVDKERLFFPGVQFPKDGWYDAVNLGGKMWRPMARHAQYQHAGGNLSIELHVETPAPVTIRDENDSTLTLSPSDSGTTVLELATGEIMLEAHGLITSDDDGQLKDIGAWIRIEGDTKWG